MKSSGCSVWSQALVRMLLLLAPLPLASSAAEPLSLKNAGFHEWEDGVPQEWSVAIGARSGGEQVSRMEPLAGGGVELGGDVSTGQWRFLSQKLTVPKGAALRLEFEARAEGLKQEGRQFNNCYIGLAAFDASGKRLSMQVRELFEPRWARGQLVVRLPESATAAEVMLFLSKTGVLRVKDLRMEQLTPADSFDVLADELDRYYSFFALKKFNWRERATAYQSAGRKAATAEEFVSAVQPLLAELQDLHVAIEMPDGKPVTPYVSSVARNFDARTIAGRLKDVKQVGRMGFVGRTEEGFGYVAVGSLAADKKTTDEMLAAFDSLFDAKALLIDLRVNSGGSEPVAQQFVSRLISKPLTYASNQFRGGSKYDNLITVGTRQVTPHNGRSYEGRVIGLIGPGCVSSGEGFALMLRALPHAKLIGLNTRGASGNPQPVALPNDVTVRYSTWVPLQLDGKPFEGTGIAPDLRVDDDPTGVKGLQAAIETLKKPGK